MTMIAYFSTCYFFYFFTDSSLCRGIYSPCLLFNKKTYSKVEHYAGGLFNSFFFYCHCRSEIVHGNSE